jgi:hypothetical protein
MVHSTVILVIIATSETTAIAVVAAAHWLSLAVDVGLVAVLKVLMLISILNILRINWVFRFSQLTLSMSKMTFII